MKLDIRNATSGKYKEVILTHDDIKIDMGWLDREESFELARELISALDDLLSPLKD